ncbi:MAG: hypothetical protein KDC12_02660 [Flavobacteriales bacterium]|nr:hypothetical protein [Flavobacteriales bacterium]
MQLMIDEWDFDEIRPYTDEEIPAVVERLIKEPLLYEMMAWVYPNLDKESIEEMLRDITCVEEFQEQIGAPAFKVVAQMTTSGLTFSHMDRIEMNKPNLFLSNHRDIILDSALLNVSLIEKGLPTTQIAIGNNLLQNKLIYDLVRINKNFIVHRNVNPREMLQYSKRLSNYIHKTITEDKVSIWIAHKEGRSKDGDDRTASGLLKMLSMSGEGTIEERLNALNIMPMVVSYEYDPCDIIKANELLTLRQTGSYEKQPGEDFKSMIAGIMGHKGGVNISVGQPLNTEFYQIRDIDNKNDKIRELGKLIDIEMHKMYRLWPSNYIAYDWLHGTKDYRDKYTPIQRINFRNYIRGRVLKAMIGFKKFDLSKEGYTKQLREILLHMYANPVINQRQVD